MITFNVITLFPELIDAHLNVLPFKKAVSLGELKVVCYQLRDFAVDSYGTVDDKPFGGGTGMLLKIEPIYRALQKIRETDSRKTKADPGKIIVLSPTGKKFDQAYAKTLSATESCTLICGRYEGIDHRVTEHLATDVVSIGDYVLSGGELPSLVIMEAVARLLPGVLEKDNAAVDESFWDGRLEYPQYTRPEVFLDMKVPDILLSGDHKKISEWKTKNAREVKHLTLQ